jgi:hypothetical protein
MEVLEDRLKRDGLLIEQGEGQLHSRFFTISRRRGSAAMFGYLNLAPTFLLLSAIL